MYRILGLVYLLVLIGLPIGFFYSDERQPIGIDLFCIASMLLCLLFFWGTLNCLDIYRLDGGELECFCYGKRINFNKINRIRKLPITVKSTPVRYTVGYISFYNEMNRKKLKFFVIQANWWGLIADLKKQDDLLTRD